MSIGFESLLDDGSLIKPNGTVNPNGRVFFEGEEALKSLIDNFDEKYVIRYNNNGESSYGGMEKHRGKGKKVIAITKEDEGYRYCIKDVDTIETEAKTGTWNINKTEFSKAKLIQGIRELNRCIVEELKQLPK